MSTKQNPSEHDCYLKAEVDEPYFTLLGRDPASSFTVLFWSKLRLLMFGPSDQISEAGDCADQMRDYAIMLGKDEKIRLAYDAFRAACVEVARGETAGEAQELFQLIALYGIKCEHSEVKDRAKELAAKLAGVDE